MNKFKVKDRQDAWTDENDLLLAETVLRHVREGSTQLNAFEEVGDILNRTSAACGFRWNAVVRHTYEQALGMAKKFRKERARAVGGELAKKRLLYTPPQTELPATYMETAEELHISEQPTAQENSLPFSELVFNDADDEVVGAFLEQQKTTVNTNEETTEQAVSFGKNGLMQQVSHIPNTGSRPRLTMNDVIYYLQTFHLNDSQLVATRSENERLRKEIHRLTARNTELERKVASLQTDTHAIQEDYETLIKIMNRARKLVVLEDDESVAAPTFRMDRNGNLERIAE